MRLFSVLRQKTDKCPLHAKRSQLVGLLPSTNERCVFQMLVVLAPNLFKLVVLVTVIK